MPRLVMYADGVEGDAGALYLIWRDGLPVDGIEMDAGYTDEWSSSGRYVSGVAGPNERLWIYDAIKGTKISKSSPPSMSPTDRKWLRHLSKNTITHN